MGLGHSSSVKTKCSSEVLSLQERDRWEVAVVLAMEWHLLVDLCLGSPLKMRRFHLSPVKLAVGKCPAPKNKQQVVLRLALQVSLEVLAQLLALHLEALLEWLLPLMIPTLTSI